MYGNDNKVAKTIQKDDQETLITTFIYPSDKQIVATYESNNGFDKSVYEFDNDYNLLNIKSFYIEKSSGLERKEAEVDITYYDNILNPYYGSAYHVFLLYLTMADYTD